MSSILCTPQPSLGPLSSVKHSAGIRSYTCDSTGAQKYLYKASFIITFKAELKEFIQLFTTFTPMFTSASAGLKLQTLTTSH
ncbi:hypothetical protein Q5P01_024392 [Channa striata]|uniref:Uncharacterized protein n=1 Tax=Channa striata TaxID=64152 RepID=A0AA88LIV5_CHASR|nr:hypothetical protein Q5P01_024392 [Channa striata]